jgi:hypothetical protein
MRAGSFVGSFSVEGRPDTPADRPSARLRVVSPEYFRLMKIPIHSGRVYDEHDEVGEVGSLPSVIVNRTLAERLWPGQDAVGKKVLMSWKSTPSVIIGVVGDVRYTGLDAEPGNEFYLPDGLYPEAAITLLVRTDRDPLPLYPAMHGRILDIDKDAFVFDDRSHPVACGHLRRDRPLACPAHLRDRHSHRDGRLTGSRYRLDASIRTIPGNLWNGGRVVGRTGDFASVFGSAVRCRAARFSNMDRRFRLYARCGVHRELPACAPRVPCRSGHRASRGVVPASNRILLDA